MHAGRWLLSLFTTVVRFLWLVGKLARQQTWTVQGSKAVVQTIPVCLLVPSGTQTFRTVATPCQHPQEQLLRSDTPFLSRRDPLPPDDGSRKHSTTLARQPQGNY